MQSNHEGINHEISYISIVDDLNFDENIGNQVRKFLKENKINSPVNNSPLYTDVSLSDNEAGYLEEDDDEEINSCKIDSGREKMCNDVSLNDIEKDFSDLKNENKKNKQGNQLELIKNDYDLDKILNRKKSYKDNYNILTEIVETEEEKIEIIKGELFLVVLQHLYIDIHNDICELTTRSKEDRIKYIFTDIQTYIEKIENFIYEKQEIFLCDLAEIHAKLNFNDNIFNDTMNFYIKNPNSSDILTKDILSAIDKLYTAGFKQ
jgi:hypothetical protein